MIIVAFVGSWSTQVFKTLQKALFSQQNNSDSMALIGSYVYVSSILDIPCRFNVHVIYPALIGSNTVM